MHTKGQDIETSDEYTTSLNKTNRIASTVAVMQKKEKEKKVHQLRSLRIKMKNFPTEQLLDAIFFFFFSLNVDFMDDDINTRLCSFETPFFHFLH